VRLLILPSGLLLVSVRLLVLPRHWFDPLACLSDRLAHFSVLCRRLFDPLTHFSVSRKRLFDPLAHFFDPLCHFSVSRRRLFNLLAHFSVSRRRSLVLPSRESIYFRLILHMFGKTKRLTLRLQ
jgi:hypothetical protein